MCFKRSASRGVLQEKTTPEVAMKDVSHIQQGALEQALAAK
jgi:hypothetical protein